MANFVVKAGVNIGTVKNDFFVLTTSPLDFSIDGGGGYDIFSTEDRLLFDGQQWWENIEELRIFGKGLEGYTLNLSTDVKKYDLSNSEDRIVVTPTISDQIIVGGAVTDIRVDSSLSNGSVISFDMATGAASGMVMSENQDGSVLGTYTHIRGFESFGTNDTVYGSDGYQWVEMGAGTNFFDGRGGEDRAYYNGSETNFTLTLNKEGQITVHDRRLGNNDVDTLVNVEELYYADDEQEIRDITAFTGVVNVAPTDLVSFIEMYIAYFNRAPDAGGLFYWGTRLSQGMSKEKIAESFFVQPETQALYSNPDDTAGFVKAVYQNFLGRAPDTDGFNYWVNQLDTGVISKPIFLLAIINGAKASTGNPDDVAYFTGKVEIGTYFSVIKGMSDTDNAKSAMALYDGSDAGLAAAKNAVDGYYASAIDPLNGEALISLVGVLDDPFAV